MFLSILMMTPKIVSSYKSTTNSCAFGATCCPCDALAVSDSGAEQALFAISLYFVGIDISWCRRLVGLNGKTKKVHNASGLRYGG